MKYFKNNDLNGQVCIKFAKMLKIFIKEIGTM